MSKLTAKLSACLLIAPALLTASIAQAHQAGEVILRAGAVTVDPREDSSALELDGIGAVPGTRATLNSNTQLGLNIAYMLSDTLAVELLAATPFSHDVGVRGVAPGIDGRLGTIKHLPPTLSLLWYPLQANAAFQPYVGAGINYTWFFDEELSGQSKANGFRGLDLDNSVGLAAQLGADFMLTDKLMLNGQIRYIDLGTTGTTRLGATRVKVDVDVDPMVYMVGLGYKF